MLSFWDMRVQSPLAWQLLQNEDPQQIEDPQESTALTSGSFWLSWTNDANPWLVFEMSAVRCERRFLGCICLCIMCICTVHVHVYVKSCKVLVSCAPKLSRKRRRETRMGVIDCKNDKSLSPTRIMTTVNNDHWCNKERMISDIWLYWSTVQGWGRDGRSMCIAQIHVILLNWVPFVE